jgi:hypothetical protein
MTNEYISVLHYCIHNDPSYHTVLHTFENVQPIKFVLIQKFSRVKQMLQKYHQIYVSENKY